MKNKLFGFVFITGILLMVAGCTPGYIAKINTPAPITRSGTPVPSGQINVPGVTIQVYAPGSNPLVNTPDANNQVASVLLGIWHGVISPVTLILSFIQPGFQIYEVHNDGSQYNFGFLMGVALVFLFLGVTAGSRRR